jgi:apolipoprotein N-acyltransferase
MLRATNTGMTAIIDPHGQVIQAAPEYTVAVVTGTVQGYAGATPYVRWGNLPLVVFALLLAGGGWVARKRRTRLDN